MIQTLSRRKLLGGLGLLIAAPAIVKASSLMPVKAYASDGIELQCMELNEEVIERMITEIMRMHNRYVSDNVVWRAGQPVVLR